jgi:NodT family efflux transporter outer membrane factor (OMF) lipoprotein
MKFSRTRSRLMFLVSITLLAVLTGCAVGPDYMPPEKPVDMDHWQEAMEAGIAPSEADVSQWWRYLQDPLLDALVVRALQGNLDLDQARSRVREARAQRGIAAAERFPTLDASGAAMAEKRGDTASNELYSAGFDAAWELDIFGRVQRSVEASTADMEAQIENLRSVQVTLLAEVALNYIEVRSFQSRLSFAQANVDIQQQTLDIVNVRFDAELADRLDVRQAESNLAATLAEIPSLKAGLRRAMNSLSVLIGEKPGEVNATLAPPEPVPLAPAEIAIGIPAELMRRRPDIRKAERELAAQTARVGVATADLYPRFRLSGSLSFSSTDTSNLFTALSRAMSVGPSFSWNIFNAGSVRNNIEVQNERQKQALLAYEKSVLTALEDVENAIVSYARELDRREELKKAVTASLEAVDLAGDLYRSGLRDFNYVLDTQRTLFTQQDNLATSDAEVTSNLIRLYKAIGGGWDVSAS